MRDTERTTISPALHQSGLNSRSLLSYYVTVEGSSATLSKAWDNKAFIVYSTELRLRFFSFLNKSVNEFLTVNISNDTIKGLKNF